MNNTHKKAENGDMTRSMHKVIGSLTLLAILLAPALGAAQPRPATAEPAKKDELNTQDKRMLEFASEAAKRIGQTMEKWIDSNEVKQDRLFAYLYYPQANTDPPKFNTDWDKLSDRDFPAIQEQYVNRDKVNYAVTADINGYVATHNTKFSQTLSGNRAMDLVNNRTKRLFNDRTGIAAARNTEPYFIQRYKRDTGEGMKDLSVPVFVKGKHWGCFRIGYAEVNEP